MNTAVKSAFDCSDAPIGDELASLIGGRLESDQGMRLGSVDISDLRCEMVFQLHEGISQAPVANFHFRDSIGNIAFISSSQCISDRSGSMRQSVMFLEI